MPRCTRSIVLVLIGTGLILPGCDDRQNQNGIPPTPPPEPDGNFGDAPTTGPADDGYFAPAPYRYGPTYYPGYHPGIGWLGGSMFNRSRPGIGWSPTWTPAYRSYRNVNGGTHWTSSVGSHTAIPSHSSSGMHISSESGGSHTSFGGFGSHASSSHAGS